jgi:uncharacterized integral membrane protein (TIGR00698 family)
MRSPYDAIARRWLPNSAWQFDAGLMTINLDNMHAASVPTPHSPTGILPGLLCSATGVVASITAHQLVQQVGVLTWAVVLGAIAANAHMLPASSHRGLKLATAKLLRLGVVLLGFSLSLTSILALGGPVIALVVTSLFTTLLFTTWLGMRMGLSRPRSLLIGTGFAICGASAIAAMEANAEGDEDDVAIAIAMVTICGTVAMIVLPLLQGPLGLSDVQFGAWAGASVHEVGQVVAAASPAGPAAVTVAVVVKLTRVLLLAPVVAGVSALRRRKVRAAGHHTGGAGTAPFVPLFVAGFLACVLIRTTGAVPTSILNLISYAQAVTLGAALFGMGSAVHVRSLLRSSARAMALATISTLVVSFVSLAGVLLLV